MGFVCGWQYLSVNEERVAMEGSGIAHRVSRVTPGLRYQGCIVDDTPNGKGFLFQTTCEQ